MKSPNASNEIVSQESNRTQPASTESSRSEALSFARQLRALGQALEKFGLAGFDVELSRESFLVRGQLTKTEIKFSFCRFVAELLRGSTRRQSLTSPGQVDLRFLPVDIERFDRRGKNKRRDPTKMPDPYSVSQILRGVGAYLDNRDRTALIAITLKGKWVIINYQTADGRLERAQQDFEYFYDYWVKMYLHRSNRPKPPPPSDPTVLWPRLQSHARL